MWFMRLFLYEEGKLMLRGVYSLPWIEVLPSILLCLCKRASGSKEESLEPSISIFL
jgi:hypothetical protein